MTCVQMSMCPGVKGSKPKGVSKTSRIRGYQKWFGVVINMNKSVVSPSELEEALRGYCDQYAFQKEVGENGTPHFQMAVRFNSKRTKKWVLDFFSAIMNGDVEAVSVQPANNKIDLLSYCTKAESRVDGPWVFGVDPVRLHRNLAPVLDEYDPAIATVWQDFICHMVQSPVPKGDRRIFWIYDAVGNIGKSVLTKHLALRGDVCICDTSAKKDIFYMANAKWRAYVWDLARSVRLNAEFYSAIEKIKDGCVFSGKYEPKAVVTARPHCIVFSNILPDFTEWSNDRLQVIDVACPEYVWLEPAAKGEYEVFQGPTFGMPKDEPFQATSSFNPLGVDLSFLGVPRMSGGTARRLGSRFCVQEANPTATESNGVIDDDMYVANIIAMMDD